MKPSIPQVPALPLEHPTFDKLIAVLAVAPLVAVVAEYRHVHEWFVEDVLLCVEIGIFTVTMLGRRPAKRVNRDASLWVLTFLSVLAPTEN